MKTKIVFLHKIFRRYFMCIESILLMFCQGFFSCQYPLFLGRMAVLAKLPFKNYTMSIIAFSCDFVQNSVQTVSNLALKPLQIKVFDTFFKVTDKNLTH